MNWKENKLIPYLPLLVLIVIIFFLVNPVFFQNNFYAESPNSFHASDAYAHLAYINDVVEVGNYNHESQFYIGFSGDQVSPREPPLMLFYVAFLSNLLGIPSYVAAQFGLLLGIILAISIIYILIKKYSLNWAIAFLPTTLLLFTFPFSASITWGFWKAVFMYFILVFGFVFFLSKLDWWKAGAFVVILASLILASPALLMFFLLLFFIKLILEKKERKKNFYLLLTSGIITLIITTHYFLNYSVARTEGNKEIKILETLGIVGDYNLYAANPYTSHFGILWYIALLGFIYALFWLFQKLKEKENYSFKLFSLFSYFFIIFLLPAVGITRIYQFRLVWPLFVAVLVGLAVYLIAEIISKKIKRNIIWTTAIITLILLIGILFAFNFPSSTESITSPETWDAYEYIHYETPKDSTLLIIDPVMTQNSIVLSANRKVKYYDNEMFNNAIKNRYSLEKIIPDYYCAFPERSRQGFNIYSTMDLKQRCKTEKEKKVSPCEFNYLLIHKQFFNQEQAQLMQEYLGELNSSNYDKVKESSEVLILKNNKICNN